MRVDGGDWRNMRWRFTITPADQPSQFHSLMATRDSGGVWIASSAEALREIEATP